MRTKLVARTSPLLLVFLILHSAFCLRVCGQSYSVGWSKISGGSGTSVSTNYSVSGTIGQADASGALSGGNYSVTGGFWSLVQVVQTPGAPTLYLSHAGNVVTVYWQNVSGWSLIQNGDLATPVASWPAGGSPVLTGGTNYLNITNPAGNVYFRLKH
jgi:hypothetical protein